MSDLFDDENLTAGVFNEILSEYDSGFDSTLFGSTDSVCIIGTAFTGPVGKIIPIYSPEHARYVFGSVFDPYSKQEATLVEGITDAYNSGCRTIYAVRVSGKSIHKDYQLAANTNLKFRISGMFPSNSNKKISALFINSDDDMYFKIFKPADRATISEKSSGKVENQMSIMQNQIELYNGGLTTDDEITELIDRVNNNSNNNVIRLSIVDVEGNDVTRSSKEVKSLKIGDVFQGVYTIGRNETATSVVADTKISLRKTSPTEKPYESYTGETYKVLSLNTNVSKDLPIFSEEGLDKYLGIEQLDQYDFLSVPDKIDNFFKKDKIDYEEVNISNFELYKRLGSGFAINAYIEKIPARDGAFKYKVKEVKDRATKKTKISDGIYSMLENFNCKYRVLNKVAAEEEVGGVLPKASEFKISKVNDTKILNKAIKLNTVVDKKDLTQPKKYKMIFKTLSDAEIVDIDVAKENIIYDKVLRQATSVTKARFDDMVKENKKNKQALYKDGSLFLVMGYQLGTVADAKVLFTYVNKKFSLLHKFYPVANFENDVMKNEMVVTQDGYIYICSGEAPDNNGNKAHIFSEATFADCGGADSQEKIYPVMVLDNGIFVSLEVKKPTEDVLASGTAIKGEIFGTINSLLENNEDEDEDDKMIICLSSFYEGENVITVKSTQFDYLTIEEVAEKLNNDYDFSTMFKLQVVDNVKSQEFIDSLESDSLEYSLTDREITYDTNLLIPYRTTDYFSRQLAQHCMYTSMKNFPTHAVMGTKLLLDTSIESVSNKVWDLSRIINLSVEMVGKKGNGTDLLDKDNMPYPIGRKISVIVGQYELDSLDNFTFISNMAAGYAGMLSTLPLDQSSTCQPINIPTPKYEFTNTQIANLTSAGYVTIKNNVDNNGLVVTDGITMARPESPYRRLSSSRIIDAVSELIRSICQPYIGKQNTPANRNSLETALKSGLAKLKNKIIEDAKLKLIVSKSDMQLGKLRINYSIIPLYEIKEIRNTLTVG